MTWCRRATAGGFLGAAKANRWAGQSYDYDGQLHGGTARAPAWHSQETRAWFRPRAPPWACLLTVCVCVCVCVCGLRRKMFLPRFPASASAETNPEVNNSLLSNYFEV